jgi:FkbM family methyltransferase
MGRLNSAASRTAGVVLFTWRHPGNRHRRTRAVLKVVAFQLLGRGLGRCSVAPVGAHSVVRADARVYHSARAMYGNPLDWNEMSAWRRALGKGSLFVDVGANVGLYTIWALDAGAEVLAIEPDRLSRRRLDENLRLNGYRAQVVPVAVGEADATLRVTTQLDNQNHLVLSDDAVEPSEPVAVRRLDDLVGDRVVDGLKIDVEGAELLVLKGARRLLETQRVRLIQLEWNHKSMELLGEDRASTADFLAMFGYELFRPDRTGTLRKIENVGYGDDVFAAPAEELPRSSSRRPV